MAELDATELKKRKTEHGKMLEDQCLCLVTDRELYVIKLNHLKKQEDVDWACLPSGEFDLVLPLPERNLCPFEFDSKIYMASNKMVITSPGANNFCMKDLLDTFPLYELRFEEGKIMHSESLDPIPLPLHKSFIANTPGSGDIYFHINQRPRVKDAPLFYVLSSGSRVWKPLFPPPGFRDIPMLMTMFVLHNRLFFSSYSGEPYFARFDSIKNYWTDETASSDNNLSHFIHDWVREKKNEGRLIYHPLISVTLPGLDSNYTVCITHEDDETYLLTPMEKVFAMLVNHHNGRVALYQHVDACFEGIQPAFYGVPRFNVVDLGNGKLCATLCGKQLNNDPSALCISVFTLSLAKDFAALQLDSGAPPMERDFLQVEVHTKSAYAFKDWKLSDRMHHAFVWPPTKGGRFQHRTNVI